MDTPSTTAIRELDVVKLLQPITTTTDVQLPAGAIGAVVGVHDPEEEPLAYTRKHFSVEFLEPAWALVRLDPSDVELVERAP